MIKQVTVTDLQRNAAKVISELESGPIIISQRGRPSAVIIDTQTFEQVERLLEEHETKQVLEIIEAGLASHQEGRTSSHSEVARRARKRRLKQK
jgi:prevent-host-death family protein